jgi:hypothetical protein
MIFDGGRQYDEGWIGWLDEIACFVLMAANIGIWIVLAWLLVS